MISKEKVARFIKKNIKWDSDFGAIIVKDGKLEFESYPSCYDYQIVKEVKLPADMAYDCDSRTPQEIVNLYMLDDIYL